MTSPIAIGPAVREPGTPGAPPARKAQGAMGKDDFLKLLVAQLKNQDPQSPANADQMAAQLAQFSSVEQLTNISKTLELQGTSQASLLNEVAAGTAVNNIGRRITAQSDLMEIDGSGNETLLVTGNGGPVKLNVFDPRTGALVSTRDMGSLGSGTSEIVVGRALGDLPPGVYRVEVANQDSKDPSTWSTAVRGTVTGLESGAGGLQYVVGSLRVPLSAVSAISTR
ncbi:MAG TPA: flagellar hook capping FlgD N-terminal domain-containing protein [Gemmatimonadaceae bacterium]|nr:flagellar hook capping FlgD N-terminal domain-containing protein [Gemmatimonadaceae bacterium]